MDKRSLLFVFCVSVTLFAVNIFFSYYDHQQKAEWLEKRKAYEARQAELLADEIAVKKVSPAALPAVKLYSDQALSELYAVGVQAESIMVAQAGEKAAPKQLFYRTSSGTKQVQRLEGARGKGAVQLYGEGEQLEAARLNELGRYDLQMVWLDDQGEIQATLALYDQGNFVALEELPTDSLALVKGATRYLPAGAFFASEGRFIPLEDMPSISAMVQFPEEPKVPVQDPEEKLYVLENEYIQAVISTRGGALAELNLPLANRQHPDRVVKAVEIDRKMVEQSPENARFPLMAHQRYESGSVSTVEQGQLGGYYPLLRRELALPSGQVRHIEPRHYAFNVVSDYPEISQLLYRVREFNDEQVVLEATHPLRRITKTYRLAKGDRAVPYILELEVKVEGAGQGLWLTTGVPEVEMISGSSMPALQVRQMRGGKEEVSSISLPRDSEMVTSTAPQWVCSSNGFFGVILDPLTPIASGYQARHVPGGQVPSRLGMIDRELETYNVNKLPGYSLLLPLPAQSGVSKFRVYAGPLAGDTLRDVDAALRDPASGQEPGYLDSQVFHGWFSFISKPIAKVLLVVMKFFHWMTHSWALSIVLLTVVLRLVLFPLNSWSMRSMRKMQVIAPELKAIQAKYKKDPQKMQMETMAIYRKHGVNPMGGCFPMLIQLPFLIGMFDLLRSSFSLRGASVIPGWIDDLAAPDVLFSWGWSIPIIGNEFHVLPILLGVLMFVQAKWMSSAPKSGDEMSDAQRQQQAMSTMMPILFTVMFYKFAAGLNLYWLSSTVLGVLQQWYINRQLDSQAKK